MRELRAAVGGAFLAAVLGAAGCNGAEVGSTGSSTGGPPKPPPKADPAAGPPVYSSFTGERPVLLDAQGRISRVLREYGADHPCPGGRRLAGAGAWSGEAEVRTLGGRRLWSARIPVADVLHVICLDEAGRRLAIVHDSERDSGHRLVVVSRRGARRVMRFRTWVAAADARRVYVRVRRTMEVFAVPSGNRVGRVPVPAGNDGFVPSPDGLRGVGTRIDLDSGVDQDLLSVGAAPRWDFKPLGLSQAQVVGWFGNDRLVVSSARGLHVYDGDFREVAFVDGFSPRTAAISGDTVVGIEGRALLRVRPGAGPPERIGTVPKETYGLTPLAG